MEYLRVLRSERTRRWRLRVGWVGALTFPLWLVEGDNFGTSPDTSVGCTPLPGATVAWPCPHGRYSRLDDASIFLSPLSLFFFIIISLILSFRISLLYCFPSTNLLLFFFVLIYLVSIWIFVFAVLFFCCCGRLLGTTCWYTRHHQTSSGHNYIARYRPPSASPQNGIAHFVHSGMASFPWIPGI